MALAIALSTGAMADDKGQPSAGAFVEAVQVNVLNLEVYVTDKDGRAVSDLTAKDFSVEDDGRKVKLTNFARIEGRSPGSDGADPPLNGDRPPLWLVIYLDEFTIDSGQRLRALEELRSFVSRDRDPTVAYAVASYDGTLRMEQTFTYDRDLVLAALRDSAELSPLGIMRQRQREAVSREMLQMLSSVGQLTASPTRDTEVTRYLTDLTQQIDLHASRVAELNGASLYALSHLANSLAALSGRKAVIYISDGLPARPGQELYQAVSDVLSKAQQDGVNQSSFEAVDADIEARSGALGALESGSGRRSGKPGREPTEQLQVLTSLANASRVSFYAYKAQGNIGGVQPEFGGAGVELFTPHFKGVRESNLAETLHVLADETGGRAVIGGDLDSLLNQARADATGYYSLGYQPPHGGDGKFHTVKVKLRGRGFETRYRRGYVDKPQAVKAADRTTTALLLGIDDNPLGLVLEAGHGRPGPQDESWILPVKLSVPLSAVTLTRQGSLFALDAPIYIAARSAAGDMAPVQEGILRIEVEASNVAAARAGNHTTEFELNVRRGHQRLAVGLQDPAADLWSFVSVDVTAGPD